MRKIFGVIIFMFLFCTNVYASEDFRVSIDDIADNGNDYTVSYSMYNDSSVGIKKTVVLGAYDVYNKLLANEVVECEMTGNSKAIKNFDFSKTDDVAYVKAFVWEDLDTMKPVANPSMMSITEGAKKRVWDFNSDKLKSLGTLTEAITVDGLVFNYSTKDMTVRSCSFGGMGLNLFGGGNLTNCSVSFDVTEDCYIKIYASSTTQDETVAPRTMVIADKGGNALSTYTLGGTVVSCNYDYVGGAQRLTLYSKASGIYIYRIEVCSTKEAEYSNIYVENFSDLKQAIKVVENTGGGNIYVQTNYMECTDGIYLSRANANVGIQGAEGYSPVLDYLPYYELYENTSGGVSNNAFRIIGSGYTIKNLIIQKVPGSAIRITGEKAYDNLIDSVVARYNNGSCVGIFQNASNNTVQYCDAYRNCDIYTIGGNADGFQAGLSAGVGNKFINCRAWENSDDGFDNFANYNDVTYIDCVCWNNGNPDIYTGKYDYARGKALDENMPLIRMIMAYDAGFKNNYNNGKYSYPTGAFINITLNEAEISVSLQDFLSNWAGNPNGFKLGSNTSKHGPQVGPEALRTLVNCIAFNHLGKGIDRNGGIFTLDLRNCISFGNYRNYLTDGTTILNFENAITFSGTNADTLATGTSIVRPNANVQNEYRKKIMAICDKIVEKVNNNEIPGKVEFDVF